MHDRKMPSAVRGTSAAVRDQPPPPLQSASTLFGWLMVLMVALMFAWCWSGFTSDSTGMLSGLGEAMMVLTMLGVSITVGVCSLMALNIGPRRRGAWAAMTTMTAIAAVAIPLSNFVVSLELPLLLCAGATALASVTSLAIARVRMIAWVMFAVIVPIAFMTSGMGLLVLAAAFHSPASG